MIYQGVLPAKGAPNVSKFIWEQNFRCSVNIKKCSNILIILRDLSYVLWGSLAETCR